MYSDWLNFQSECKRKREQQERIRLRKRQETLKLIKQFITYMGLSLALLPVLIYMIIFFVKR
jgi:ABC-type uncharacterized transport system involved in gliding motility auxiliary subunit